MTPPCPSDERLQKWLAIEGAADDDIASHVADCGTCQTTLDRLTEDPTLRTWAAALAKAEPVVADAPPPDYYLPSHIGQYRIERELGRGGMGIVYLAQDEVLNRPVALKLIRRDALKPETRERFLREVRAAAKIPHANVVGVYASGEADNSPWLAMEYIPGPTLSEMIRTERRLGPRRAADFAAQIADGLAAAHRAGLVHRDVKPANVLLHESTVCKLTDFGLVFDDAEIALTSPSAIAGTPAYLSPEQARGDAVDARSDVYALGVTLYEMLTGEPPFRGPPHQVVRQIIDDEPRPPRQVDDAIPADLETITLKALAKEPGRRYATSADLAADLRRYLNNEPILARPTSCGERGWRWCRRNPRLATMGGLTAVALIALGVGGTTAAIVVNRANTRTEASRVQAEEARRKAEANQELAIKSYITLVDGVQKQMGSQPGLLPLKRKLLETAADGLKQVVADSAGTDETAETLSRAYHRLGIVLVELGRTGEGKEQFEAGVRLGEAWAAREPGNVKALRAIADTADRLGDLARYAEQVDAARAWYGKAHDCRIRIAGLAADDAVVQRDLSISLGKLGDLDWKAGDWAAARGRYEEALRVTECFQDQPSRKLWLADMAYCRGRVADVCTDLGDFEAADREAAAELEHARELLTLDATAGRVKVIFALEAVARVASLRFDAQRAIALRQEAVALRRATAAADPGNVNAATFVAYSLHNLGGCYGAAGDRPATRAAWVETIRILTESLRVDTESGQWALYLKLAYDSAIENEVNDGQFVAAAALTRDLIAFCRQGEAKPAWASLKLDERRRTAETELATCEFAAKHSLDASPPVAIRKKLLRLLVLDQSRRGSGVALSRLDVERDGDDAHIAARAFARLGRVSEAVAALKAVMRLKPEYAKDFHLVAEFALLRDSTEFQAFRKEMFQTMKR